MYHPNQKQSRAGDNAAKQSTPDTARIASPALTGEAPQFYAKPNLTTNGSLAAEIGRLLIEARIARREAAQGEGGRYE